MRHIQDDGQGFQPSTRAGLGLSGMQERVEALAGRFALTTSDAGTSLTITLPLAVNRQTADQEDAVR